MFINPVVEHHAPNLIPVQENFVEEALVTHNEPEQKNSLPNIFQLQAERANKETKGEVIPWYSHGIDSFDRALPYNPLTMGLPYYYFAESSFRYFKADPLLAEKLELYGGAWNQFSPAFLEKAENLEYLSLFTYWPEIEGKAGYGNASYIFNLPHIATLKGLNLQGNCLLHPENLTYSEEELWAKIASFENLTYINLQDNPNLTLNGIEALQKLPQLKTLLLGGWHRPYPRIRPSYYLSDLTPLAALQQVEFLSLSPPAGVDLSPLQQMQSLRGLKLEQPGSPDLTPLASIPSLEALTIHNHRDLKGIGKACELKALYVENDLVQPVDTTSCYNELFALPQLEYAALFGKGYSLESLLPYLNQESTLSHLVVNNNSRYQTTNHFSFQQKIGSTYRTVVDESTGIAANWGHIQHVPHVTRLELSVGGLWEYQRAEIEALNFGVLATFTELEELHLGALNLTEWQMEQLSEISFPSLKVLQMKNAKGNAIENFAPNLTKLDLTSSNAGGGELKNIAKLTKLEELYAGSTKATSTSVTHLAKSKSPLRAIDLSDNQLQGANFAQLKALVHLESLNLNGATLARADFLTLKELQSLKQLDIRKMVNPNITKQDIDDLVRALPHCTVLTS